MKLLKSITLILCLLFSALIAQATPPNARASISATATVIPMLGVMPTGASAAHQPESLLISESTDSILLIQVPKNSTLQIHISNAKQSENKNSFLLSNSDKNSNAVADFISLDLKQIETEQNSRQIITIITTDN